MTQSDQTTSSPTDLPVGGSDPASTGHPTTTVVSPVAPGTSPAGATAPSQSLLVDQRTGKTWEQTAREKDAELGRLKAENGRLADQVQKLQASLTERDAAIAQLNANVGRLAEEVNRIPGLQQEIAQLKQETARGERYRAALQFPDLLRLQTEVPGEDEGQAHVVNPVLELIEASTMGQEDLARVLEQMNRAIPRAEPGAAQPKPAPTVPPRAEPVQTEDLAYWEAQVEQIHKEMIEKPGDPGLLDRYFEATRKAGELRAAPR